jgi:hypothetical protein
MQNRGVMEEELRAATVATDSRTQRDLTAWTEGQRR